MCNPLEFVYLAVAQRAGVAPLLASSIAIAMRDHAGRQAMRGSIEGFDAEGFSLWARVSTEEVEAVIAAMVAKGLIVDGMMTGIPPRAMTSTERSRRRRERLRLEAATGCNDAALHNVASVAHDAADAKALMRRGNQGTDATPSRARLKEGSENPNQISSLPDLKQERLHTSKEASAARARNWLASTMQYAAERKSEMFVRRMWAALMKLKDGEKRPVWLQRELDRLDDERRGGLVVVEQQAEPSVQPEQRELPLMRSIQGGAIGPPPEMVDYRGAEIEPLSAVGD